MQTPIKIRFQGTERSEAVEGRVRERVERLERLCDRVTNCRVVIETPHRHQHKGRIFEVRIQLDVPGREIVVDRDGRNDPAHEDVYVALRDAFDAAERRLASFAASAS
jgi:ribosome-associated translation inhibitor RaiA